MKTDRRILLRAFLSAAVAGVALYVIFRNRPNILPLSIVFGMAIGGRYLTWIWRRAYRARVTSQTPNGSSSG